MKAQICRILIVMLLLALTACGFKLRGQISSLPFESINISAPVGQSVGVDLERAIASGTTTQVIDDAEDAEAILQITNIVNDKRILSLSGGGRVREFQLIFRLTTRLVDSEGVEIIPASEIVLTRFLPFLDTQILAKLAEERLLYENMQADAVQQIIWRLAALQE